MALPSQTSSHTLHFTTTCGPSTVVCNTMGRDASRLAGLSAAAVLCNTMGREASRLAGLSVAADTCWYCVCSCNGASEWSSRRRSESFITDGSRWLSASCRGERWKLVVNCLRCLSNHVCIQLIMMIVCYYPSQWQLRGRVLSVCALSHKLLH